MVPPGCAGLLRVGDGEGLDRLAPVDDDDLELVDGAANLNE